MFVSLSKTLARFGGFRLGLGVRMKKSNAPWMLLIYLFVLIFQAMWYALVICFWLMYAACYGLYWCIKKAVEAIKQRGARTE